MPRFSNIEPLNYLIIQSDHEYSFSTRKTLHLTEQRHLTELHIKG